MIEINRESKYAILIVLITFVASTYLITANTLGVEYGSIYQMSKYMLLFFLLICSILSLSRYVKVIDLLLVAMMIWNVYSTYQNGMLTLKAVADICTWPMVFIAAKNFEHSYPLSRKLTNTIYVCTVIVLLLSIPNIVTRYYGNDYAGYAIGAVYSAIVLIPILLLLENTKIRNVLIICLIICAVFTTKRTAFIAVSLSVLGYYLLDVILSDREIKSWKFIRGALIICIAIAVGIYVINKFNLDIFERMSEVEEDGGSGRDEIWDSVIMGFKNSNLTEKVRGHGYHSVAILRGRGQLAHNDYLEILYDYGVVGLLFVVFFLIYILIRFIKAIMLKHAVARSFLVGIIFFVLFSTFSYMMSQSLRILYLVLFFGYVCSVMNDDFSVFGSFTVDIDD